ncbi:hypothetical protein PR048_003751 [Dryococelus australis]|uniref:Uncharacterized protein n=1 Tax=Dryococelus australis TaxID=614101 RepID=A0ABQ9IP20_9NEOP|nr:hypothetical protein PR048_003751 [Dryococelus australis]
MAVLPLMKSELVSGGRGGGRVAVWKECTFAVAGILYPESGVFPSNTSIKAVHDKSWKKAWRNGLTELVISARNKEQALKLGNKTYGVKAPAASLTQGDSQAESKNKPKIWWFEQKRGIRNDSRIRVHTSQHVEIRTKLRHSNGRLNGAPTFCADDERTPAMRGGRSQRSVPPTAVMGTAPSIMSLVDPGDVCTKFFFLKCREKFNFTVMAGNNTASEQYKEEKEQKSYKAVPERHTLAFRLRYTLGYIHTQISSASTTRLPPVQIGFDSRLSSSRICARGNRVERCHWSVGFLGHLPRDRASLAATLSEPCDTECLILKTAMLTSLGEVRNFPSGGGMEVSSNVSDGSS